MKTLFQKRRHLFLARCLKYSRYVLNDHFVLFLLVFFGFLSLQYRQLLENFPENPWFIYLVVGVITLLLFFAGQTASYLEPADSLFLLPQEDEVISLLHQAGQRHFLVWGTVQLLCHLLLYPVYVRLGFSLLGFVFVLFVLTMGKYFWIQRRLASYRSSGVFQWEMAVSAEIRRKQSILQFFALFTRVKGITTSVNRRAYLDSLLAWIPKKQEKTWLYLYARAFLRSGDFLSLTFRLLGLSLLSLLVIEQGWLAMGLVLLFDYLLLFQLLALFHVYDYQYLTLLYPLEQSVQLKNFQAILRVVLYAILALQLLVGMLVLQDKMYLLHMAGGGILLNQFYLAIKAKKLID